MFIEFIKRMGKRVEMRGLPSILSLYSNEFNKFNNTRARMLDSVYHVTLRLLCSLIADGKTLLFYHNVHKVVMDAITFPENM